MGGTSRLKLDEESTDAEWAYLRETQDARDVYEAAMKKAEKDHALTIRLINDYCRDILEKIALNGGSLWDNGVRVLTDSEYARLKEMEGKVRKVERDFRSKTAPIKAAYERA